MFTFGGIREQGITRNEKEDLGGQDTRCVQINAAQANAVQASDGSDIAKFFLERNWGTAGEAFLEKLYPIINDPDRLHRLRKQFECAQEEHICPHMTKQFPKVTTGQLVIRSGHLAICAMGQYFAMAWLFGMDPKLAWHQAIEDAIHIGVASVNLADFAPLSERALAYLRDHFWSEGHRYINLTDEEGWRELNKRQRQQPVMGLKLETEVWYFPSQIDWVFKRRGWDPRRIWHDLAECGALMTDGRHMTRYRQLSQCGVTRQRLYVLNRAMLFPDAEIPADAEPAVQAG